MTQIMNLLHLAPDIQEELLFLPLSNGGRDPIREHMIRQVAAIHDWGKQKRVWEEVRNALAAPAEGKPKQRLT